MAHKTVLVPSQHLRVVRITPLNINTFEVIIELSGLSPICFLPGQYLELSINDNAYPYSIATDFESSLARYPHTDINSKSQQFQLHIGVYKNNSTSKKIIGHLGSGLPFKIAVPKGYCSLDYSHIKARQESPLLLVVASTGFAQAKSLIDHCIHHRVQQEIRLYWGVRDKEEFYLLNLLAEWKKLLPNFSATLAVSNEPHRSSEIRHGNIDKAVLEDFNDLSFFKTYICGSPNMVYSVADALCKHKLNMENTFSDVFDYLPRNEFDKLQSNTSDS